MIIFILDDNDCNVRYFVVTDITLLSCLVYRPPIMLSADKNVSVKSADQHHTKFYTNT